VGTGARGKKTALTDGTEAARSEVDTPVDEYERLRDHVLAGRAAITDEACHLLLLVREGIAAWIERRRDGGAAAAPTVARERPVGAPLAAEDFRASLVRVLAGMAISNGGERRSGR
jgi:hypothetical protein